MNQNENWEEYAKYLDEMAENGCFKNPPMEEDDFLLLSQKEYCKKYGINKHEWEQLQKQFQEV